MPRRKKIKDMTPAELKAYRQKKYQENKILQEKEEKKEAKLTIKRIKSAEKAAKTRKKNKAKADKEEIARQRKNKIIAKKAAITRKKNAAAAKKAEKAKKKADLEARRAERAKNKIVFDHKPIKEMNEEEYKAYKTEYARIYNERKRNAKEKTMNKRISSRLSGKAKASFENGFHAENSGKRFIDIKEDKRYMMAPLNNNGNALFKFEGLNIYCEMTSAVSLINLGKNQLVKVSLSIFIFPNNNHNSYIKVKDFWKKDVTDKIKELTATNYQNLIQPITTEKYQDMMKNWTTMDFIKTVIRYGHRHKVLTAEILWDCLEMKYSEDNDISMDTLMQIAKPSRKVKN